MFSVRLLAFGWAFYFLTVAYTMAEPTYTYTLRWKNLPSFTYGVQLGYKPAAGVSFTDFKVPAWRPGRYLIQDYAAAISHFEAKNRQGQPLPWTKIDKDTWRVQHAAGQAVDVSYRVYANTVDAGSSYVDGNMAYFNGSNFFMYAAGREAEPTQLTLPDLPADWRVATGLAPTANRQVFVTKSYHDLIDCPTICSPTLKTFQTTVEGLKVYVHFQGNYQAAPGAEKELLANFSKFISAQKAVFGDFPTPDYHFIFLLTARPMRHAVEHINSAMFVMPEGVARSAEAFRGLYGISSHEFWHLWNVKTIRPAAMWPYDYSKQAYTRLHWFTEGVTDYYAYLMLARSGVQTTEQFLDFLASTIGDVENSYAATVVSAEDMSFDTWLGTSRYGNPNHQISFYTAGCKIGLLLDAVLRTRSKGKTSLDAVFRYLYENYYKKGLGVPEDGVQKAAETLLGASLNDFFTTYVAGKAPFDNAAILGPFGLELSSKPDQSQPLPERLGMLTRDLEGGQVQITALIPDSDAERAGILPGDLLLDALALNHALLDAKNGQTLELKVQTADQTRTVKVTFTGRNIENRYALTIKSSGADLVRAWLGNR
jgi:predicted metalloprotease with PDZ domain